VPSFGWKGKTAEGFEVKGEMKAPSKELVIAKLRAQRIIVSSITESGGQDAGGRGPGRNLLKGMLILAVFLALLAAVWSLR
jgi:type II secretory pathway component PulF